MKTLSAGCPSTLGTYKSIARFFGQPVVDFIQAKIDESPLGEDEPVLADESQMLHLFAAIMNNPDHAKGDQS